MVKWSFSNTCGVLIFNFLVFLCIICGIILNAMCYEKKNVITKATVGGAVLLFAGIQKKPGFQLIVTEFFALLE